LEDLDFTTQAAELEVPVYFFVGRYDVNAMASLAERYYDVLDAPHKELIWFEKSGHPPLYSEANKLVDVMVNRVLARVAPRLGSLAWAKGSVPTPHGLITVHATAEQVTADSPVPVIVDLEGQAPQTLPAGHHEVKAG
jgi:hypothetical protein